MSPHYVMPSEEECISWAMGYDHPASSHVAFETIQWLKSRIKPVERLSDGDMKKLKWDYECHCGLDARESPTVSIETAFEAGYRACEARILGEKE